MTGSTRLTNLRNILAELYPDEASMRRLMADADINVGAHSPYFQRSQQLARHR